MNPRILPDQIDPIIHERTRLAIVSTLALVPEMSFNDIKESLSLTDGNLSAHARTLEDGGYVEIEKTFRGRRPLTTLRLTPKGRAAFQNYLSLLQRIVAQGKEGVEKRGKQNG